MNGINGVDVIIACISRWTYPHFLSPTLFEYVTSNTLTQLYTLVRERYIS